MNLRQYLLTIALFSFSTILTAQNFLDKTTVSGSLQIDGQYYMKDSGMGINDSTLNGKHYGLNAFGELHYNVGNFSAGMRFESYTPQLNGFDEKAKGFGIPYFYAAYNHKYFNITIGDFYEQFGSGLTLRSYQEWNLGYDNAIRGGKLVLTPYKGIKIIGLCGYQRWYWDQYVNLNEHDRGLVSGVDGDFNLNDIFNLKGKTQITLGGSFVSKHESDLEKTVYLNETLYKMNLPENVASWSGRLNLTHGGFGLYGEYAYKINNPSAYNGYIYHPGQALYLTASYSKKGFGVTIAAKRIDNMSFKSKMTTTNNALDISFIPPLCKQHHYSLPSLYPYASQLNGEMSLKGNVIYTIPKHTTLGGKYGMSIEADFTIVYDIKKEQVDNNTPIDQIGTLGYKSPFFKVGDNNLYRDFNVVVTKKFNQSWKGIFTYINLLYDKDRIEGHPIGDYGKINGNIGVADVTWKINSKNSLRWEVQGLFVKKDQDRGNWATLTVEYSMLPHWFLTAMDEWNYGNPDNNNKLHYYYFSVGYIYESTRVALSYGRQREGLLCVGGVCRYVPAASGLSISISSSF